MDPIRPIGPPERDLEPVVRVTRTSPDAERQRPGEREQQEQQERQRESHREQAEPESAPAPLHGPDEDGSLIDIKV
jgi:hypothetical protein